MHHSKIPYFKYRKSDIETVNEILRLPRSHQGPIARIIWWDWFAGRLVKDRTTAFDRWLEFSDAPEPSPEKLMESLLRMGYPADIAHRKLRTKKYQSLPVSQRKNRKALNEN